LSKAALGQDRKRLTRWCSIGRRGPVDPVDSYEPKLRAAVLAARADVEARYERESLEPLHDFDLGMIEGKLSALRWVLGDNWDFLDT
jgi:hypothetical protein